MSYHFVVHPLMSIIKPKKQKKSYRIRVLDCAHADATQCFPEAQRVIVACRNEDDRSAIDRSRIV
jgi:hypothetical protein